MFVSKYWYTIPKSFENVSKMVILSVVNVQRYDIQETRKSHESRGSIYCYIIRIAEHSYTQKVIFMENTKINRNWKMCYEHTVILYVGIVSIKRKMKILYTGVCRLLHTSIGIRVRMCSRKKCSPFYDVHNPPYSKKKQM